MKIPGKIIPRNHYIDRVRPFIGKSIIKVFTGQRRVGKSYILFQLIKLVEKEKIAAKVIYINKEDIEFSFIENEKQLHDHIILHKSKTGKTFVFIDEIQEISNFEKALRSLLLDESLDLYCTGSNATMLSGELATLLSGRFIEINVFSLSYLEFLNFHDLKSDPVALNRYMKFGGLPYLIHLPLQDEVIGEYLKNIYSTIVFRDVISRYNLRNANFLEQLILFLSSNIGSLFSAKKISDFLRSQQIKMAPNQVRTYITYLENSFLIHAVKKYDLIGKRLFEFGEKFYFENLGIRNAIWGYRLEDRGKIIENIVYNQLIYLGYKVTIGILENEEIDFVCERGGEKKYVQVALTLKENKTIEREFGNLKKMDDNYPKIVITLEPFNGNTYKGIQHIDLEKFLLDTAF